MLPYFPFFDKIILAMNLSKCTTALGTLLRISVILAITIQLSIKLANAQVPKLWLEGNLSMVEVINDGFEDMNISPFTTGGNASWTVQGIETYAGSYAARSGAITHNQSTYLELNIDVPKPSVLSFAMKVSTEEGWDFLTFTINGSVILNLSGLGNWEMYSFDLSSGNNILKWTYTRDPSLGAGDNAVYLDDVLIEYVDGQLFRMDDGTQGRGKILTSDVDGYGIWQKPERILTEIGNLPLVLSAELHAEPFVPREHRGAPLILENSHPGGYALRVTESGVGIGIDSSLSDGIFVHAPGSSGMYVDAPLGYGIWTSDPTTGGFIVDNSQGDGFLSYWAANDGFFALGSEDDGMDIDYPDSNGITITDPGAWGIYIEGSTFDGIYITNPTVDGINIRDCGYYGIDIDSTDFDGIKVASAAMDGIRIYQANDDGIDVYHPVSDGVNKYAGYFNGHLYSSHISKSGGSFQIDHPLDPENKYLFHSFVESPDMMNVYNGNVILDENGEAIVVLEEWFEALNRDFRYQLTCIGGWAQVYIADKIADNRFRIAGGIPGLEVSWQVTGIRKDPYANANRIEVEVEKPEEYRGSYLNAKAWALEKGVAQLPSIAEKRNSIKEEKINGLKAIKADQLALKLGERSEIKALKKEEIRKVLDSRRAKCTPVSKSDVKRK